MSGERKRYVILVPLSLERIGGAKGIEAFAAKHAKLLPPARRASTLPPSPP